MDAYFIILKLYECCVHLPKVEIPGKQPLRRLPRKRFIWECS